MLTRQDVEKVLEYMDSQGLIRLSRSGGGASRWKQLHCPFHSNGQERRPSCGCSLEEETKGGVTYPAGFFNCFACGAKYTFGNGIKEILAMKESSLEAHPFLKEYVDENFSPSNDSSLIPEGMVGAFIAKYAAEDLHARAFAKPNYITEEELAGYRYTVPYMYQRKLTDPVIEKYDVGFDGKFILPGRKKPTPCVTFPVRDIKGNTLFICRRSIEGKMFHMPQGIEKPVYGVYELPPSTKEVIICESIFNALTCVVYGHPAVALLGTGTR